MAPMPVTKEKLLHLFKFNPLLPKLSKQVEVLDAVIVVGCLSKAFGANELTFLGVGPKWPYTTVEQAVDSLGAIGAITGDRMYPMAIYKRASDENHR